MIIQIDRSSTHFRLTWWPTGMADPWNHWSVFKETGYEREIPILPATISDSRPSKWTRHTASEYMAELQRAISIAERLDDLVWSTQDFKALEVVEHKYDTIAIRCVGDHVRIYIPEQEEGR